MKKSSTKPKIKESMTTSLKIIAKEKKLTRNQQLFNTLTKRIQELEIEIKDESEKLQKILEFYSNKLKPILSDNASLRLKTAISIGNATTKIKFGKKQAKNIKEVIIDLCIEAFTEIEPNDEQKAFYDKWSEVSYEEQVKIQESETKEILSDFMSNMFGLDIDINEFDDSPEGYARLQEKLRSEFEKAQEKEELKQQTRKKTKKQIQYEEQIKAEEEVKNKSVRSIYIALAKLLHPDSETDPKLKAEKEEIMKKVTSAYDQKDLHTLLKLEAEWVHKETEHLEKLTDDKLKIYISALKEQVEDLTNQKYALQSHPKFADIEKYARFTEKTALSKIRTVIKDENKIKTEFTDLINTLEETNDKKKIMEFVDSYMEELDEYDDLFDMFDQLPFF